MSINEKDLTEEEKYFLLRFSYIDLLALDDSYKGQSIRVALENALKNDAIEDEKITEINSLINEYDNKLVKKDNFKLDDIKIVGYENHNPLGNTNKDDKTGFVGYALEDKNGNRGFLFRGSEPNHIVDWTDNGASYLTGTSTQVEQANDFFNKYKVKGKINSLYGHSKGSNLATEVFLNNLGMTIFTFGVNGQPVFYDDLTEKQKTELRGDRYTFIVHEGDFVSGLGKVDYIDKVVDLKDKLSVGPMYPHYLTSVRFDDSGNLIGSRPANTLDYFLQDAFQAGQKELIFVIPTILAKRYTYFVIDGVKLIYNFVSKKAYQTAMFIKDKCIEYVTKIGNWTEEQIQKLTTWFNDAIEKTKLFFKSIADYFSGGNVATEKNISVNTSRLRYYSQQLSSVRRKVMDVNNRIESLYFKVDFLDLDNILKADLLTISNHRINESINYLNTSAELLENAERKLVSKANSI